MFLSVVHPVAILNVVFCVICSLLMFVSDDIGDHVDCVKDFSRGSCYCDCTFWWFVLVVACCHGVIYVVRSAVLVEWLLWMTCCVEMCGRLFVMYGSSVFSSDFAIIDSSEMGLYDVPMFMSSFGVVISMMFASVHV